MIEWVQENILTLSFGGISITTIIGFVWFIIKDTKLGKSLNTALTKVNELQESLKSADKKNKEHELLEAKKDSQIVMLTGTINLLTEGISTLVVNSGNIDPKTKLAFRDNAVKVIEQYKTMAETLISEKTEELKEIATEVVDDAKEVVTEGVETVVSLLDSYIKKV